MLVIKGNVLKIPEQAAVGWRKGHSSSLSLLAVRLLTLPAPGSLYQQKVTVPLHSGQFLGELQ